MIAPLPRQRFGVGCSVKGSRCSGLREPVYVELFSRSEAPRSGRESMCTSVVEQDQMMGGEGDEVGGKVDGRSEVSAMLRCQAAVGESGPDAS